MESGLDLISRLQAKQKHTGDLNAIYHPQFFRLSDPQQKNALEALINSNENIQVFDHIQSQVQELVRCLQPTIVFLPPAEMDKAIEQKFGGRASDEYGVWVYYPWNNKLVHLLDEEEFSIVRTNRNKYKITHNEQEILNKKKIGVMGLSVGQSVSMTLAMERAFGELRIADFDTLDLSNINRIRTGVYNLKLSKTIIVAREIAEIDPFLKVTCFHEGITAGNMESFLTGGGTLDLLIDECDSFDIKINARERAKALGIPVLMEGSDRGTIDIERFDLEPERPVLHGLTAHLDMEKYVTLTTMDERVPYITAVTGAETLSPRMKGSAIEIMSTISTWPQLASAVTYGGGVTADLARKILLGNLNVSGRFFLDLDELIKDENKASFNVQEPQKLPEISIEEMKRFVDENQLSETGAGNQIDIKLLEQLIRDAQQAPSGGNNQPWRFYYQEGILHLFMNESVTGAFLDPDNLSSYLSIGGCIENLLLAAAKNELEVDWELTPHLAPKHLAWFKFKNGYKAGDEEIFLAKQIHLRHTNRKITPRQELPEGMLEQLNGIPKYVEGSQLKWLANPAHVQTVAGISAQSDIYRLFIPEAYQDFIHREMRWTPEEALEREDGIGVHTLDLTNNDLIGMRLMKDRRTIDFLQEINGGNGLKRLSFQQFMSASAIGLITIPTDTPLGGLLNCGRYMERLWLTVTGMGWQLHPVNVPLLFFYKNTVEKNLLIPEKNKATLAQLENTFNTIFENNKEERAVFMFRIFKASPSPERTIRKSTHKIFSIGRA